MVSPRSFPFRMFAGAVLMAALGLCPRAHAQDEGSDEFMPGIKDGEPSQEEAKPGDEAPAAAPEAPAKEEDEGKAAPEAEAEAPPPRVKKGRRAPRTKAVNARLAEVVVGQARFAKTWAPLIKEAWVVGVGGRAPVAVPSRAFALSLGAEALFAYGTGTLGALPRGERPKVTWRGEDYTLWLGADAAMGGRFSFALEAGAGVRHQTLIVKSHSDVAGDDARAVWTLGYAGRAALRYAFPVGAAKAGVVGLSYGWRGGPRADTRKLNADMASHDLNAGRAEALMAFAFTL